MIVAAAGRTFVVQSVISSAPLAALERDGGNGRLVSFLHGNRTAADNAGGDSGWGRGGSDELLGTQTGRDLGIPTSACSLSAHRGKRRTDVAGGIRSGRVIEAQKIWPVIEDMDHLPAPSTRRIAIYTSRPDSLLAANQLAAIQRYACAMGWVTVAIVESDEQASLTLLQRTRLTWCYAGGPATSDARSPWFNDCLYIASNFWQWRRAALL